MVELVLTIAVLAIIIMGWSRIAKGLDWAGDRIGNIGDIVDDIAVAGAMQTARAVVISDGSLEETIHNENKRASERAKEVEDFERKLEKNSTSSKAYEARKKRMEKYLNR